MGFFICLLGCFGVYLFFYFYPEMFMEIKSIFLIRLLCDGVKILPVVPNHSSYLEKEVTDHSVGNRVS